MAGKHAKYRDMVKSFGSAVRHYRNKLGFSQEALADRAQLDRSYMSQIERGIKNATLNSIWRISAALEVRPSELLQLAEDIGSKADPALVVRRDEPAVKGFTPKVVRSHDGSSSQTVLVVDDDDDICSAIGGVLVDAGFRIHQAPSGMEAMRLLAMETVQAVISDVRMANGNGLELLASVRRHYPGVPLFFITGYDDMSEEDAISRGASGLFNKPFDLGAFVSTVRSSILPPVQKDA